MTEPLPPTPLTKARGNIYAVGTIGAVSTVAMLLATFGYIDYDPATRLITIPPFTVDALLALIPGVATLVSAPLAWIAVKFRWGRK